MAARLSAAFSGQRTIGEISRLGGHALKRLKCEFAENKRVLPCYLAAMSSRLEAAMPLPPRVDDYFSDRFDAHPAHVIADPILAAAARCIQRKGLDNVSLEEVAVEANISRTTLYRRFGNRESLFTALLVEGAQPFRIWSQSVLSGPGRIEERVETVLARAIMEMQHVGWLDRSLHSGISPAGARLFKAAQAESSVGGLGSVLSVLIDAQAAASGLTLSVLNDWIADQMIALASAETWNEDALRCRLRYLVMPVLIALSESKPNSMQTRLDKIERKIDAILTAQSSAPSKVK